VVYEQAARSVSRTLTLKDEGDGVALLVGLDGDAVVVAGALEDLVHGGERDAERDRAVAAEVLEAVLAQQQRHERHVARVHGLQRDAGGRAIKVAIGHEVLDGLEDLLEESGRLELGFELRTTRREQAVRRWSGSERDGDEDVPS